MTAQQPPRLLKGIPLAVRKLRKAFGAREVLKEIDLHIPAGQFVHAAKRADLRLHGDKFRLHALDGNGAVADGRGVRMLGDGDLEGDFLGQLDSPVDVLRRRLKILSAGRRPVLRNQE